MSKTDDRWATSDAYEVFMGRWSRHMARAFIAWLEAAPNAHWLDIGCGTGALTSAICELATPASVVACDPSESFVDDARRRIADRRVAVQIGGAADPPRREGGFDAIVSRLVINFVSHPEQAMIAMRERLRPGGLVAAYVWDYRAGMQFLRLFWDEAVALDSEAASLDEGSRFPLCDPQALVALFRGAGLVDIETRALKIPTRFESFDDYWRPFLGGTGPAPAYVASLSPSTKERLREQLEQRLAARGTGAIELTASAWAVRGKR